VNEPAGAPLRVVADAPGAAGGTGRVQLAFTPQDTTVRVPAGVSVFDAASWNGIAIDSTCGGHGTCHKCKVRVTAGAVPQHPADERAFSPADLRAGWRLACLARAHSDLAVDVPPLATRPKAATVGVGRQVILRPAVQKRYVELDEPTLDDQRSDLARLTDALDDLEPTADLAVLRELGPTLRACDQRATAVVVGERLVAVEPGDTTAERYGLAVDLGTTTAVATLVDLATGTPLAARSMLNRQQPYGGDVISRISATMLDGDALERLRALAQETLATLTAEVCAAADIPAERVYEVCLAGNATMVQILLGIDPEPLGVAPFVLATQRYPELAAADLGVPVHPGARAFVFPALGAYAGGDVVAGALAAGMDRDRRLRLFIDVGTNCEIVIGNIDRLTATAAPAGPAFEGGQIRCGMRAAGGAIEAVQLGDNDVTVEVIDDAEPAGLCGSGLVDAVAELVRVGLLDHSGRLVSAEQARALTPGLADRLTTVGEERVFVLAGPLDAPADAVYLSQRDVRELQFAKASIATGWRLLCDDQGIDVDDIKQVLLAGSFGTYLSPAAAVRIGLVPALPLARIVSAGNVAGEGAKMALLSSQERAGADALLEEVTYVELSDRADFNDRFVDELAFPGG
jgi:uncharacterized 2Fe-2S/4Fe-4S cluster protein (DUF4445 family)